MNKKKWLQIFNSILRLQFFMKTVIDNGEVKNFLDSRYQEFIDKNHSNPNYEKVEVMGGDFFIGFSYLIFIRINEYIDKEMSLEVKNKLWNFSYWEHLKVKEFDDFIKRYGIKIIELKEFKNNGRPNYSNENEKLSFLNKKIRNSLSHYKYKFYDNGSLTLFDSHPSNGEIEMKISLNYYQFVNYIQDFGIIVNNIVEREINTPPARVPSRSSSS